MSVTPEVSHVEMWPYTSAAAAGAVLRATLDAPFLSVNGAVDCASVGKKARASGSIQDRAMQMRDAARRAQAVGTG